MRPPREFTVVVPVLSAPGINTATCAEWASAADLANVIEEIEGARTSIRQNGGFIFSIQAQDQYAAVEMARDLVDRMGARAELSTRKPIAQVDSAWVRGVRGPIPFLPRRRQVDIGALALENKIYSSIGTDTISRRIDDALLLAQPLEAGSRSAAISGGWAAVEALLSEGHSHHLAAHRLSTIVACSYPRAELTNLSYIHSNNGTDSLADQLKTEDENLPRARLVADAIDRGDPLSTRGPADESGRARMKEILASPRDTLRRVQMYVNIALDRLRRQRNLTLHGGRVSGSGRTETLWTVPPLVGAGLDRIVHAWFAEGTEPFDLFARADLALELVGSPAGPSVTELLEPS